MDGVLVDTEPLHIKAFQIFMDRLNLQYQPEYIHSFVGFSIEQNVRKIKQEFRLASEINVNESVKLRDKIYLDLLQNNLDRPLTGIMQLLEFCRSAGIETALASSSSQEQVDLILDLLTQNGFDLRTRFKSIVNGDQVNQRKPEPDIYLKTLQNLNRSANECWAIEDSGAGVQSARAANIPVIGLTSLFSTAQQLQPANKIVVSIPEVEAFLKDLL